MRSIVVQLGDAARFLEPYLDAVLTREEARGTPVRLVAAMRHALLGGGKRFRPFLLIQTAEMLGVAPERALTAAAAIEAIHCYSLVHDDLPSMDNDIMRRGQPTVWRAFDEWTAILAGDALQTLAFELLASAECDGDPAVRADLVLTLAVASGAPGMVGGQVLDLEAEKAERALDAAHIAQLQAMKTGRLIVAACEMGSILGRASTEERAALKLYGEKLGLAFQISDDLLDAEGSALQTGKATGKDAAAGKATLVGLLGIPEARRRLDQTISDGVAALKLFGSRAQSLTAAAEFMGGRST